VNHTGIKPLCEKLHKELYEIKNQVQLNLGFIGDSLEVYLRKYKIPFNTLTRSEKERIYEAYPALYLFKELEQVQRNFDCLIVLSAIRKDINLCKPLFKGFGTSTGRIILRAPALQNLNSKYRYLLKDECLPDDKRYVYIDYGQFEAGVLAGLTGNKSFIGLYEQDKVYEMLAAKAKVDRKKAKKIFYCFIYGGIIWRGAESFFTTYGLKQSIDKVEEKAFSDGFVETPLGNRRKINTDEDKRLILNHYVQGTSSLIFKQALIDVHNTYRHKVRLVLPMHDAALYIVDKDVETLALINIYRAAFKKWLPNVNPIVKEKDFFVND
jgi:DNA polymerase I-like protein with 3'-5' exonuclease and polymerase domains